MFYLWKDAGSVQRRELFLRRGTLHKFDSDGIDANEIAADRKARFIWVLQT